MRTHPNPPTGSEIKAAREIVIRVLPDLFPSLDKEPIPPSMKCWAGQGWHRHDVFVGILVGLEIAKARAEKKERQRT